MAQENGLLLNTKVTIIVTNDGTNNQVVVESDMNIKMCDLLTSIKLAERNYYDLFQKAFREKVRLLSHPLSDTDSKVMIEEMTLGEANSILRIQNDIQTIIDELEITKD